MNANERKWGKAGVGAESDASRRGPGRYMDKAPGTAFWGVLGAWTRHDHRKAFLPISYLRSFAFICGQIVFSFALAATAAGLGPTTVIAFDLDRLNASGLQGPPGGQRALDYEFCIPRGQGSRDQVAAIDPSARFYPGSRGRSGCGPDQVLVLGNTHQPGYRAILLTLAALPFVTRIAEALFE
ncbi:hypothetical protein [Candidatus Thiodictyon syntrophicum]|jgi:hypothetical protein|uniref:hypothetical protein n=1 Tax=Candidatus Thiodictyon syntrophicum TaxID=1166950 RepID=UPI001C12A3E3|nr:hypothetical protein [Candidatus Thiodictyon syntrophicum]